MIDIHTHILPGLDDGSPDMETSLRVLKIIEEQGVSDLFVTPHFIEGEYDNKPYNVREKMNILIDEATKMNSAVRIHQGVEVYLSATINEDIALSDYCLGNSRYILVESALNGFPNNLFDILYKMVKKGYKPILAHPERYVDIMKNTELAEDLVYRNVYMQANAGSFFGYYGANSTKTVWELFYKGLIHFIASDCHCHSENYPLSSLREMLSKEFPDYPIDVFFETNPRKIINNEKIEHFGTPVQATKKSSEGFLSKILRIFND